MNSCTKCCRGCRGKRGRHGATGNAGPAGADGPAGPAGQLEHFVGSQMVGCEGMINVLEPTGASVVGVVIETPDNAALMRSRPDGNSGGDCRGVGATDWQSSRKESTQVASGEYSAIGGGINNTASEEYSSIGGGENNTASGYTTTIGGGGYNTASIYYSTVSGGKNNEATGGSSTIGGGGSNIATGNYSVVGGGFLNTATGDYSVVGGGVDNEATGDYSVVGGGGGNETTGDSSTVGGGAGNEATGDSSTVGGGDYNIADGELSGIGGGEGNITTDKYSYAVGSFNNPGKLFMVGNGTSDILRSNAFSVSGNGEVYAVTYVTTATPLIGEYKESLNGNKLVVGTHVMEVDGKVTPTTTSKMTTGRVAHKNEVALLGSCAEEEWVGKYELSMIPESYEEWVSETEEKTITKFEDVIDYNQFPIVIRRTTKKITSIVKVFTTVDIIDDDGNKIGTKKIPKMKKVIKFGIRRKLSDKFDNTIEYIPRSKRDEWCIVVKLSTI